MSQNSINFGNNALGGVVGLARQISLPAEHRPLRFPSFPALERTATMGFNAPVSLAIPAATTVVPTYVTLCRQAAYPVWADRTVPVYYSVSYNTDVTQLTILGSSAVSYNVQPAVRYWESTATGTIIPIAPAITGNTSPLKWAPLGSMQLGAEFTYVPASCVTTSKLILVGTSVPSAAIAVNATVVLEYWVSPEETITQSYAFTISATTSGNAIALAAPAPSVGVLGYWVRPKSVSIEANGAWTNPNYCTVTLQVSSTAFAYTPSATTGTIVGGALASVVAHLPLVGPVEFSNSALPWAATRVTAAAFLSTNVTQVLQKNGTVLGGRISPNVYSPWNTPVDYVSNLHPAEKAYLPLETGIYTYAPPSTDLLTFSDYTLNVSAGAAAAPVYNLDNNSLYNRMIFTPNPSTPETMACTVTWHIEFRTSSALFDVGLCGLTLESLHQAQLQLAQLGFFFENPRHKGILMAGIKLVKQHLPKILGAISPAVGRVLKAYGVVPGEKQKGKKKRARKSPAVVYPPRGPSQPKSTDLRTAGAVSKGKREGGLSMYLRSQKK